MTLSLGSRATSKSGAGHEAEFCSSRGSGGTLGRERPARGKVQPAEKRGRRAQARRHSQCPGWGSERPGSPQGRLPVIPRWSLSPASPLPCTGGCPFTGKLRQLEIVSWGRVASVPPHPAQGSTKALGLLGAQSIPLHPSPAPCLPPAALDYTQSSFPSFARSSHP